LSDDAGSLSEKKIDEKARKVVVPSQVELRSEPKTGSIIKDTLYQNNAVEKIDESGQWIKIEYRDRVEGKIKRGWVLNYYLDQVE
jgi:hypothetical protein